MKGKLHGQSPQRAAGPRSGRAGISSWHIDFHDADSIKKVKLSGKAVRADALRCCVHGPLFIFDLARKPGRISL
jgi:hypothetical protein